MRRFIFLLELFSILIVLSSCANHHQPEESSEIVVHREKAIIGEFTDEPLELELSYRGEGDRVTNRITTIYNDDAFSFAINWDWTLSEWNEHFPIEYIRREGLSDYTAVYKTNKSYVILSFNTNGQRVGKQWYPIGPESDAFSMLQVGMKLTDVMTIDPNGTYWFLITGSGQPLMSSHLTSDGYVINVYYDYHFREVGTYMEDIFHVVGFEKTVL